MSAVPLEAEAAVPLEAESEEEAVVVMEVVVLSRA